MKRLAITIWAAVAALVALIIFWKTVTYALEAAFGFRRGDGDTAQYLFWSGVGGDLAYLSFLVAAVTVYRRHNCAYAWCPRIGKHEFADPGSGVKRMLCWKHHPDVTLKTLHAENVQAIQQRRHLYVGKNPGKG